MLLNVFDRLGDDDLAGVPQGAALDGKAAAADGCSEEARKRERFSGGRSFIEHLRDEDHALIGNKGAILLNQSCTRASFAELAQSIPDSLSVSLISRLWKPSIR